MTGATASSDGSLTQILKQVLETQYVDDGKQMRRAPLSQIKLAQETVTSKALNTICEELEQHTYQCEVVGNCLQFEDSISSRTEFKVLIGPDNYICTFSMRCSAGQEMSEPITLRLDGGTDLSKLNQNLIIYAFIDLMTRRSEITTSLEVPKIRDGEHTERLAKRNDNVRCGLPAEARMKWRETLTPELREAYKNNMSIERLAMIFEKLPVEIAFELCRLGDVSKSEVRTRWATNLYERELEV